MKYELITNSSHHIIWIQRNSQDMLFSPIIVATAFFVAQKNLILSKTKFKIY